MSNWLREQTQTRPFTSALVVLLLVFVPGYLRLEVAIDTANDAADSAEQTSEDLAVAIETQQKENEAILLEACQIRNTASAKTRARFDALFDGLEAVLLSLPDQTPERAGRAKAFVDTLRASVSLDPALEDVDCNQDKQLTKHDYAP